MILNGATLDPANLPIYDICTVGSGAVGFAIAHELWNRGEKNAGKNIVVLGSGIKNVEVDLSSTEESLAPNTA